MSRMSLCMERLSKTFPDWAPAVRTAARRIKRFKAQKSIVFCIGNGLAFKNNLTGLQNRTFFHLYIGRGYSGIHDRTLLCMRLLLPLQIFISCLTIVEYLASNVWVCDNSLYDRNAAQKSFSEPLRCSNT